MQNKKPPPPNGKLKNIYYPLNSLYNERAHRGLQRALLGLPKASRERGMTIIYRPCAVYYSLGNNTAPQQPSLFLFILNCVMPPHWWRRILNYDLNTPTVALINNTIIAKGSGVHFCVHLSCIPINR